VYFYDHQGVNMKKYWSFSCLLLCLLTALYIIIMQPGCQDPHDFEPPPDTLVPPPNTVPELIFPPYDTAFIYGQDGHGWDTIHVCCIWYIVPGAQYYDIEVARDTSFSEPETYRTSANSNTFVLSGTGIFYWHVRAGSDYWTWYTEWSDIWQFYLLIPPFD
jgi:hypothetical protein